MADVALDEAPSYCALSYRWSDPDPESKEANMICNGVEISLGPNLYQALIRVTDYPYRPSHIWVDYVCIEQQNDGEKQSQFLLMPQIYRQALRVYIWLGPGTNESDAAMTNIQAAVSLLDAVDESQQPEYDGRLSADQVTAYKNFSKLMDMTDRSGFFEAIWNLLNREWFGRVWTVQEAALASEKCLVMCGNKFYYYSTILHLTSGYLARTDSDNHWVKLVDAIRPMLPADPERPWRPILAHSRAVLRMQQDAGFLQSDDRAQSAAVSFLNGLRMLDCIDPRDRIFSAVPFLSQDLVDSIRRRSPMTAKDLYVLYAASELDIQKEMRCLAAAGLCYHRRSYADKGLVSISNPALTLPSWVPDWTYPKLYESLWVLDEEHLRLKGRHLYQASGETKADIRVVPSDNYSIAIAKGIIADTILAANTPYHVPRVTAGLSTKDATEAARNNALAYITHTNDCISLALKHAPADSSTERNRTFHDVRKALFGDLVPTTFDSVHGAQIRAQPEQIDQMFLDKERHLEDLNEEYRRSLLNTSSQAGAASDEGETQQQENMANWIREYRSRPKLTLALAVSYKGRRFFVTEKCRFGIGPSILQPGDMICVFLGGQTPFVIRRVKESRAPGNSSLVDEGEQDQHETEPRYELVGECYINDLMDGEAIKLENMQAQSIYLV